ncbi:MAG TPA: hypothetical protein VE988_17905, partial [Gemmataceae bacterium]|nr:hypothetical protein [Gemmataceae bacterium]
QVTQQLEVIPSKPAPGALKRPLDNCLIRYIFENKSDRVRNVGTRVRIDTMCGNNDGAIFASPTTHPGVLLDGVMLEGEKVPEFIEMLEKPNLQNPGFKGIFTFKMAKHLEPPNKIVLTSLGAFGDWDVPAMQAGGDSAVAFFWDPKEVKAKAKREIAFALGQGIATNPDNEGKVATQFSGNFEPNKEFTVTAYIEDPIDGQNLTLELPKGMERVGGKATQTVPTPNGTGQSVVMWKARVVDLGTHVVRIRSSNGVTYTRTITVSRP